MNRNLLANVTGFIFAIIAVAHFIRFALQWEFSFAGKEIPLWASVVAAFLAGYLAYEHFRKRKTWYVCTGTCGGISSKSGVCGAADCPKKGIPLEEVQI